MAHPKWHLLATLPIAVVSTIAYPPTTPENIAVLVGVVGLGIFIDIDHLSIRRVKKILRKDKGPVLGWINWMHTWQALIVQIVGLFLFGNWLPFISYAVHILIDGGNSSAITLSLGNSPLSDSIHRFYPRWLTYETGLII